MIEVTLPGGQKIKVLEDAVTVSESGTALFKKEDRAKLSDDKRNDLFSRAIYQKQKKYDLLNLAIEYPTKLSETYDLGMNVLTTKDNFTKYDMHDVFTITLQAGTTFTFHDLFTDYSMLTVTQVADSNNFYSTMTDLPDREVFQQNLRLTAENLQFNCDERLRRKVEETYNK